MDLEIVRLILQTPDDCNVPLILEREGGKGSCKFRPSHDEKTGNNYPVLYAASSKCNDKARRERMIPIIECLIERGADPYLPSKKGDTILHHVCECNGIIEPFLDIPSLNLEIRDSQGRTLLLAACCHDKESHGYVQDGKYLNSLPTAASLLLSKGANVDTLDSTMRNALHCILSDSSQTKMRRRDFDMIVASPSASTLVKQADNNGETPLLYAIRNQHFWAIDALLDKGTNPEATDHEGNTALHLLCRHLASSESSRPYFEKFLDLGIPVDTRNEHGQSPLMIHLACSSVYMKSLPLLTDAGADLFALDASGQGLLHTIAGKRGSDGDYLWRHEKKGEPELEVFKWLMDKGLDPAIEDREQRTPLDLAMAAGNDNILRLFERQSFTTNPSK